MTDRQLSAKLRAAIATGDHVAIQRLIKGGVDVNTKFWYDSTLLHEAVSLSQEGLVEMLIRAGADVNSTNQDGRTPLHLACRGGQLRIVKMLIAAGTDLNKRTLDGKTCLHVAVWRGHLEVVEELVNAGADPDIPDSEGCTPVYWAARSNYLPVLEVLVKAGAKINYRVKNKWTPLHMALHLGHMDIVRYLLQHGSETNVKLEGKTIVTLLMENRHLTQDVRERTLDMFITAGYQVQSETWTPEQATTGPKDIKPTAQELAQKQEMAEYVDLKKETVPKLSCLCRTRIRKRLSYCNKGRSIAGMMTKLPVPIIIAEFLGFQGDPLMDPTEEDSTE